MPDLNKFTSNHQITEMCNLFFFKHKVPLIQTKYFLQTIKFSNIILNLNKIYILSGSRITWTQKSQPRYNILLNDKYIYNLKFINKINCTILFLYGCKL